MPKSNTEQGQKHEQWLAKQYRGSTTAGSGAKARQKGDVLIPSFCVQAKSTRQESLSFSRALIEKAKDDALMRNRRPAIAIRIEASEKGPREDWICFRVHDDIELRVERTRWI